MLFTNGISEEPTPMKEKHFFITAIIIVFVIIAGYLIISIVSPFEPQEAELPPLPEQIVMETDIYLDYDSLPEAEDIPWEEYPCDLTPIINAIKELDKDFDETGYRVIVSNYSVEKKGVDGSIQFIPGKYGQRFYYANIGEHRLTSVYYNED